MKSLAALLALPAIAALASPAQAGTNRAVMEVRAVVVDGCSVSATPMTFELDTAANSTAMAEATVSLDCNAQAVYEIALDSGSHAVGETRRMTDEAGGGALAYEIYRDAGRSTRWGDRPGVDTVSGTAGANGHTTHVAYGAIRSAGAKPAPGTYSDAVVVTVNF